MACLAKCHHQRRRGRGVFDLQHIRRYIPIPVHLGLLFLVRSLLCFFMLEILLIYCRERFYTVFDTENSRVGFAYTEYTNATVNN